MFWLFCPFCCVVLGGLYFLRRCSGRLYWHRQRGKRQKCIYIGRNATTSHFPLFIVRAIRKRVSRAVERPVSYTHLDVYKRQVERPQSFPLILFFCWISCRRGKSVSYTHLESLFLSPFNARRASFTSALLKWLSSSSVRLSKCSKNA